jgi:peptidoglycan/LPS O-acetylase OafA/YrhL
VFFVISGFLITSLLTKELAETGKISIRHFYARRALRLLPASTVVLFVTLIASWAWLSPLRFGNIVRDIVASAFYFINFRLAGIGTDYLASAEPPSPVQHFWSLAVEEQFYMFWPVLILLATLLSRRRGQARFGPLAAVLATLTVGSLALSWFVTRQSAPWAYFGTHARAWELGLGALVALGAPMLARMPRVAAEFAAWSGLGAIIAAALLYDEFTPFPGIAALLPVAGAASLIAAGCGSASTGRLLSVAPMRVLGKLSYGWYLWHWPLLIIVPAALDRDPSPVLSHGTGTGATFPCGGGESDPPPRHASAASRARRRAGPVFVVHHGCRGDKHGDRCATRRTGTFLGQCGHMDAGRCGP